jgi:hypothetical protein
MNTRIMCVMAMSVLLSACGGSSSSKSSGPKFKDPNAVNFTYGAKAPTASTDYDDAASFTALTGEAAAMGNTGELLPDLETSFIFAGAPLVANMMVFDGIDLSMFTASPVLQDPRMAILRGAGAELVGADPANPALQAAVDCQIAIDDSGLDIDHCKASFTYTEDKVSDAANASLSGKFARGADAMTWSFKLSVGADLVDDSYSIGGDLYGELTGQLAVDAVAVPPTFAGYSRVSYTVDLKQADTLDPTKDGTFAAAVTDQADIALTLNITDECANGGTITLKRVWTTLPVGTGVWDTTGSTITDESAIITFTAPTLPEVCTSAAEYQVGTVAAAP